MYTKAVCMLLGERNVGNQGIQKNYYLLSVFYLWPPLEQSFLLSPPIEWNVCLTLSSTDGTDCVNNCNTMLKS